MQQRFLFSIQLMEQDLPYKKNNIGTGLYKKKKK